jgi:drug/metabolite transporter (DMT)-like permease
MITMEPASGAVLGLLIHRRWPGAADVAGMLLLLSGVLIAIRIFARPVSVARATSESVLR